MSPRARVPSSMPWPGMRRLIAGLVMAGLAGAGAHAASADAPPPLESAAPALPALIATPAPARGRAGKLPDCSRPLSLGLHEHGLLYTAQTGEGIDKDIAEEMARRSGCHLTLTVLPRARIWQLIETGALDMTLSGISTAERDKFAGFAWYMSNKYYLLVRHDLYAQNVEEFRRRNAYRIGLIRSFRYGDQANQFVGVLQEQARVTYAGSLDPLYTALLDGGIEAMIVEPFDFPVITGAQLKAQTRLLDFGDPPVPHGLVMSRMSLPPGQQQAWREIILAMRADGTIRRIFEKYFPADLARQMTQFPDQ